MRPAMLAYDANYKGDDLIAQVRRILGTDKTWNVLLVGAGNLGRALPSLAVIAFGLPIFGISFTNVPDPRRRRMTPRCSRSRSVRVTVVRETPYCCINSASVGRRCPGTNVPF